MAATPPSDPKPAGDDRNPAVPAPVVGPSFEDRLHTFWEKNRSAILGACGLVLLAIIAKGAWDYLARQKELDVQRAYAAASTSEQLKTFASAHPDHELGAVAQLRLADEAYAAGKSADAIAGYDKARGILKDGPLGARARLGIALAKLQAGNAAEGTKALQEIANDANQLKGARAEAVYHLASLAAERGDAAEVQKLSDQLMQIDASSPWSQRVMALRASLPAQAATAAPAPAATQPAAKGNDAKIEVKLPGKN